MMQPSTTHAQQQPNPCLAAALQFVPEEPQTEAVCPFPVNPLQLLPTEAAEKQFVHYSGKHRALLGFICELALGVE